MTTTPETTSPEARLERLGLATHPSLRRWRPMCRSCAPDGTSTPPAQLPLSDGALIHSGTVGAEVSLEEAQAAAQQCTLDALAAIKDLTGNLSAASSRWASTHPAP